MTTTLHHTPDDVPNSGDGGAGGGSSTSILMTLKEVCFETRLCRTTVYQAVKARQISIVKIGRATRFVRAEVFAWIGRLIGGPHN